MEEKSLEKKDSMENKELILNSKAMWALGLGIVGILGLYLLSFIAVVVGILSIKEINKNKEKYKGIGFASAGLVLGILGALANIGQHILY
jgi:apolipoprotein N-acyltransferase